MATKLTKKQQTQLTEKLTGIIQKNNALQLRLSADRSVNEMNVNQISGALNRILGQAIGKELPTAVTIPVKQLGSGDPSRDNIRPVVGYEIDGIGTVYGGELNIETGVLTVTYGSVDLGTMNWTTSGNSIFAVQKPSDMKPVSNTRIASFFCGIYFSISGDTAASYATGVIYLINQTGLRIKDTAYTDAATFKASLSGVMLVYELATPETYTLTPQQMLQLLDQL